jgi:hypothetical protein
MGLSIALWIVGAGLSLNGLDFAAWALFGDRTRESRRMGVEWQLGGPIGEHESRKAVLHFDHIVR